MCAAYSPPTEDITQFNSSLFNQPEETLSQAEADLLYLSKTKNDTSTATLTTFNNQVTIKGDPTIGTIGTTGYLYCYKRLNLYDVNSPNTNFAQMYMIGGNSFIIAPNSIGDSVGIFIRNSGGNHVSRLSVADASTTITNTLLCNLGATILDGQLFNTRQIKSTTPSSISHQLFDNMTAGGQLTIGNIASSNKINGYTNFVSSVALKNNRYNICEALDFTASPTYTITTPMSQTYTIRSAFTSITITLPIITSADAGIIINLVKVQGSSNISAQINNGTGMGTNTIYTQNDLAGGTHQNTTLLALNKMATTLLAATSGGIAFWVELGGASTYDIAQNNLIYPRLTTDNNFTNRLNFSASSYSFPFASSQSLGYYLKTTGTAFTTLTSAVPKTIVSTASIPIGVWRIDFSVINLVTSAGTITQSQTYISPTLDGNVGTAVVFTGSVIRSHVSEVYALNDVQELSGSFTYQQTTAGVLRLNIVKSFGSGTYSFTGEIAITRLA